ncbi:hypothetical protein AVEN_4215-1 [Araneus ventricosus]|uniref:Uncharacterized protein n=1 Tax=Araneus ventricosus TaxID=182803 RepID=A0A4Y2F7X2_ARAVE|nr:hypothetical protein AVEN_4215-1 [Araneus ventricosus]
MRVHLNGDSSAEQFADNLLKLGNGAITPDNQHGCVAITEFDEDDEYKSNFVGDLVKIVRVTYNDVVLAIRELKSSLTVGAEDIPSFIIKGCAEFFIYPLLVLFNLSLRTKVFPHV